MNPTKTAAVLALIVAVVATACLGYSLYENTVLLKSTNAALDCVEMRIKYGDSYDCDESNPKLTYAVSGGIAVVSLIASLALFGAAKPK